VIVVVAIENTFAQGPDLRTAASYRSARPLYEVLKGGYQLIGLSSALPDIARWWLKREHMAEWANLRCYDPNSTPLSYMDWRVDELREFLASGFEIAFYLDSDWTPLMKAIALGVSTLRIEHAQRVPGFRDPEELAPRAWASLATNVGGDAPIQGE
jgi:hypothetical protein